MKQSSSKKPNKSEASSSLNMDINIVPARRSRFFVMKMTNGNFDSVSPFLIDRLLTQSIGRAKNVSKTRDGLLIEVDSSKQATCLLDMHTFGQYAVSVEAHKTLNTTKGKVTCRDLLNCTTQEILENLSSQGVVDVRRRTFMKDGIRTDTATLILTFNTPDLPKTVKAGYLSLPVTSWIPAPLRCFRCQKFGHTSERCGNLEICPCGHPPHGDVPCPDEQTCVNCNGPHSAKSNQCPTYKLEMAIQQLKTTDKISYPEARRRIYGNNRSMPTTSYATIASNPSSSRNMYNIQELVAALVPELCRALGLEQKANLPLPPFKRQEPVDKRPSPVILSLKNPIPTSVLKKNATPTTSTTTPNTQEQRHYDSSKVTAWFEKNNDKKEIRSKSKLKRNKAQATSSATSVASAGDDISSNQFIDESGSSSGAQPPKRKNKQKSVARASSDADSEEEAESLFDATPKIREQQPPLEPVALTKTVETDKT